MVSATGSEIKLAYLERVDLCCTFFQQSVLKRSVRSKYLKDKSFLRLYP